VTAIVHRARDPNFSTETVKAPAWKNIVFETNGASHLCDPVYATEQEAREIAERALADAKAHRDGPDLIWTVDVGSTVILVADIARVFQIPWTAE
jgi:hypothetical protein